MQLDPREVLKVLRRKGVQALHHANTARTALSFLIAGGLLSRGEVEARGLDQTPQWTDTKDREVGIWFDVFVDGIDIHSRGSQPNKYGPVLFEMALELLESKALPPLWITRDNPYKWKTGETNAQRYYQSVAEFDSDYRYGDYFRMITLRNAHKPITFTPFLQRILLDNPRRTLGGVDLFANAFATLSTACEQHLGVKRVVERQCPLTCRCEAGYARTPAADLRRLFWFEP